MSKPAIAVMAQGGKLVAADPWAEEQIAALPMGAIFAARLSKLTLKGTEAREGLRGKWWAGLDLLSQNVDHKDYDTQRKAHETILRGLGFVRPRYQRNGSLTMEPVSTKNENMDDDEFEILFERARTFVLDRFNMDPWEMWEAKKDAEKAMRGRR